MTKIKGVAVLALTAVLLLLVANAQRRQTPAPRASEQQVSDAQKLNAEPQKQYPTISLAQQRAAMRRIEQMRRKKRDPNLRAKTPPAEWIQMPYHGLLLDANLEVIEMTPANVLKIQESIFAAVQKSARSQSLDKRVSELSALFNDRRLKQQERLAARGAVLGALLAEADEQTRLRYDWRVRLLRSGEALGGRVPFISPALARRLQELRVIPDVITTPLPPGEESEYVRACREQQVPIPPDWPDPRWTRQGPLGLVFISAGYNAVVHTYKDPAVRGTCYALPRSIGRSVGFLGIICQSATTGYACFWDNKEADGATPIIGTDVRLDIDSVGNGRTLAENCTMCHRGDNVFNIHPGTALDLRRMGVVNGPYETDTAARYTPIGQPAWVNPPPFVMPTPSPGQDSCVSCHTLPETAPPPGMPGRPYCTSVLENAARLTMPPFGTQRAQWPPEPPPLHPRYRRHIEFLADCP